MGGGTISNSHCSDSISSSSNQVKSKRISLSSKKRNNNKNNRNNNSGLGLKSSVLSILIIFMMFCSFFLPSSFIYAVTSPVRNMGEMYPLSLVDEGNALAGIKGFEYEYGYLPTSEWIGLVSDLGDGNFIVRADIINILGTGLNLQLGMTYNSYNSTIDIGAGKGWMTDLHQVVSEDGVTHDVTFVTATEQNWYLNMILVIIYLLKVSVEHLLRNWMELMR